MSKFTVEANRKMFDALKSENESLKAQLLEINTDRKFSQHDIELLQHEVYQITGKGEVMALFNKLLGVSS